MMMLGREAQEDAGRLALSKSQVEKGLREGAGRRGQRRGSPRPSTKLDRDPLPRDDLLLGPPLHADEERLAPRLREGGADGEGVIHVPGRPAARQEDPRSRLQASRLRRTVEHPGRCVAPVPAAPAFSPGNPCGRPARRPADYTPPMLTVHLHEEEKGLCLLENASLASAWPGLAGRSIWVDVENPTDEEARELADVCGFHHLTVEDALTPVQPPKVEEFAGYLFLLFRGCARRRKGSSSTATSSPPTSAPASSSRSTGAPSRPAARSAELVLEKDLPMESQMDRVLHALVDRMMDEILPILDRSEERLEEIEEAIFSGSRRSSRSSTSSSTSSATS